MIRANVRHIHQDIKKYLSHGCSRLGWNPYYYQELKNYIVDDMIRLNKLCNQGNRRSFAICINDFLISDKNNHPKFDEQKFLQLCRQTYGTDYHKQFPQINFSNSSEKFAPLMQGHLAGRCFTSYDFKDNIIAYQISRLNIVEALAVPYHEYGHTLDAQYSLLDKTEAYLNYRLQANLSHQNPEDPRLLASKQQYAQDFSMLKESFADCFAYSCLALKEPENPLVYKKSLYNMASKFCNIVENRHSPLYCGYAAVRTMLNKISTDCRCHNMQKYYLPDNSINFLKLAETCAEVVTNQGYNHSNYQTLLTYPLQKKQIPDLQSNQYDQWHYDYLDAQNTRIKNQISNPAFRLFLGIGSEIMNTRNKTEILALLDKHNFQGFQKYFNEYRKIINSQIFQERPTNLAQKLKQQKNRN